MSTQTGILSKFDSKKLWTVPSKDQYLPSYFKRLCDSYLKDDNPRRVFPVECVGLQQKSNPTTWEIGSNLHVSLDGGVAERLNENISPYAVLGSEMIPLPVIDIGDDVLDGGAALKKIVEIEAQKMGENFVPALLVIGGMGLAVHYEELSSIYDGVPLVMAYGLPVSGKSLAVQIAMALIGEDVSIGECTQAGVMKLACSRTLPFWWDDVSDFNILETLTVQTFNQSQRQTAKPEKACHPRSIPIMTMNPQCLYKKRKVEKEKISRVFSRVATIPFKRISGIQTLEGSLELKASLQPVLKKAVLSVGTLIELRENFRCMKEDVLFKEICPLLDSSQLDMRSQLNYALLLFSTGKILEKLDLKEQYFTSVKAFFLETMLPSVLRLLEAAEPDDKLVASSNYNDQEVEEYMLLIKSIVDQSMRQPQEASDFFVPKSTMKNCKCGDVCGFKVVEALQFIRPHLKKNSCLKDSSARLSGDASDD